jgi:hypothetical protein
VVCLNLLQSGPFQRFATSDIFKRFVQSVQQGASTKEAVESASDPSQANKSMSLDNSTHIVHHTPPVSTPAHGQSSVTGGGLVAVRLGLGQTLRDNGSPSFTSTTIGSTRKIDTIHIPGVSPGGSGGSGRSTPVMPPQQPPVVLSIRTPDTSCLPIPSVDTTPQSPSLPGTVE